MVCETMNKPLILFHLLLERKVSTALIFTKSSESTNRLLSLFTHFMEARQRRLKEGTPVVKAAAFSSDLNVVQRKSILEKFKNKQID